MGTMVFTDAYVSIGGNDVSDHVQQVTLDYSAETADETAMGDNTRNKKPGLKDWNLSLQLHQDYADSNIDDILFAALGTEVAIVLRPDSAAVGANNPEYTGQAIVTNYQPLAGAVGDLAQTPVTLEGTGDLSRAES